MPWSDYIPFLGGPDEKAKEAQALRIRYIIEDIRNRHAMPSDGSGPAALAEELESIYGPEEQVPGWRNADQYRAATEGVGDLDRQGYMSPERYDYMQNAGRDIDFLANVEADPDKALYYWDRSNGARSTRKSLWGPNYQRYSDWGHGAMATVADRRSVIAKYLQNMSVLSNAVQDMVAGTPASDAILNAGALNQLQQRANIGENPIGTLPDASPDATPEELQAQWAENSEYLRGLYDRVSPRSGQYIANNALGGEAPRVVGDITSTAASMADPTLLAGLSSAASGARAAARALPAAVKPTASQLAKGAIGAIGREAKQEATFAGLLGLLLSPRESHTASGWADYFTAPAPAPDTATEQQRREAADQILSPAWQERAPKIDRFGDFLR